MLQQTNTKTIQIRMKARFISLRTELFVLRCENLKLLLSNFMFVLNLIPDSSVDFHIQHSQSSDGENAGEDQAGPVDVKS